MNRRDALAAVAAATLSGLLARVQAAPARRALASARIVRAREGLRYEFAALHIDASNEPQVLCAVELPARAHGVIAGPRAGEAIVCARRPGKFLWRIDIPASRIAASHESSAGSWFQGHACLSADRRYVYASEVDAADRGWIGVFDATSLQRIERLPSHGVEPHELLLADPRTLLIAHGGRSDTLRGDARLPDARCESTLTWLDIASAKPIAEHRPADARISLRHLARVRDGAFLIGAQSDAERVLPMLALATPAALHTLPSEPALRENYIASVASDGVALAACAERDGCALRFADASATPATQPMGRVDGAAFVDGVLWLSRVDGRLYRCATRLQPAREFRYERIVWDNHLSVIDLA